MYIEGCASAEKANYDSAQHVYGWTAAAELRRATGFVTVLAGLNARFGGLQEGGRRRRTHGTADAAGRLWAAALAGAALSGNGHGAGCAPTEAYQGSYFDPL
jgi:hypothetical protein